MRVKEWGLRVLDPLLSTVDTLFPSEALFWIVCPLPSKLRLLGNSLDVVNATWMNRVGSVVGGALKREF